MSQVASLRRARERRAAETPEQTQARREKARLRYHENKLKGKHQTSTPTRGIGGYVSYTLEEVN